MLPAVPALDPQVRERRRVKELFRYFQPFQIPAHTESKPRIATDASLTALAQLAAFKLKCQRCFISLIDNTKQYIIAEATQTISLISEDLYERADDKLSFGQTVLDFKTGVCPGTIACFTSPDDSLDVMSTYIKASRSYYVMNDMSMLEGYQGRSYVKGWPHMRFYAEVPIHSPSGTCIGTLCVVDNKARNGLDLKGIRILEEISGAVMNHLELCASKIQQSRAERMIHGLGQFLDGHVSVQETSTEPQNRHHSAPGMRNLIVEDRAENEFLSEVANPQVARHGNSWDNGQSELNLYGVEHSKRPLIPQEEDHDIEKRGIHDESIFGSTGTHRATELAPNTDDFTHGPCSSTEDQTSICVGNMSPSLKSSEDKSLGTDDKQIDPLAPSPDSLGAILYRAANLIRENIGLDGVVFLNPRSIDSRLFTDFSEVSEGITRPSIPLNILQNRDDVSLESHQVFSKVMSCSTKRTTSLVGHIQMPEETLQILLKHFPRGGLVNFDSEGILGAESLTSLIGRLEPTDNHDSSRGSRQESFVTDIVTLPDRELRRIFPGVTSLMIYPFWDNIRDECVAHCMAWTSEPARVFRRQEFTYVASLSNSVTAELSRTEIVAADKAKSRFISSISHELRTPLHGIMASMELLRDLSSDASFQDLFSTIESCGSTLLDTIENVLAFSQASNDITMEDSDRISEPIPSTKDGPVPAADIEILVEEVTSICMTGAQFRRTVDSWYDHSKPEPDGQGARNFLVRDEVMVICDIDPGDWLFETNGAVWRRILLNLVSNSLKYTSRGFIVVTLRQQSPSSLKQNSDPLSMVTRDKSDMDRPIDSHMSQNGTREVVVNLSIKDSGKGMSQDYLAHSLFKPFHQENSLAQGTGLGLSIVKRLVQSIGGKINVTSEEGIGTEIMVEVPLQLREGRIERTPAELLPLPDARLGIVGLKPTDLAETPTGVPLSRSEALLALRSTITTYAAASNLLTVPVESVDSGAADILIIQDSRYRLLEPFQVLALSKPVIVLCMQPLQDHEHILDKPMNVVLLSLPFGPRKFQRIIESCLRIRASLLETSLVGTILDVDNDLLTQKNGVLSCNQAPSRTTNDVENTSVRRAGQVGPPLLLVEDNPINLKILVTSISRMGRPFLTATNGVEAVEAYKASSTQILLVFMDIQMPTMNGIEASREIRSYEKQNALPRSVIVALTALDSAEAKQAAVDSGVDLFFTKPVSMGKLKEIVTRYYN